MPPAPPSAAAPTGRSSARGVGGAKHELERPFPGFRPIDANFIYTPNQFFDHLLPAASRPCVRLVAYLLRRTLGWLGPDGRPVEQQFSVTWRQLIADAGVSRGSIAKAVDEAVAGKFIRLVRKAGTKDAKSARYELNWDESGQWKIGKDFDGFFTGEGRRSPIPDAYFDEVVRRQPLAVARVVGVVLRQTIGYQNQFGGRRQQAALSFTDLQRRCGIADRKTLSASVHTALDAGYIRLARAGTFDPDAGRASTAAEYGVRWLDVGGGPETPPAGEAAAVQKTHRAATPARSKTPTGPAVQKPDRPRSNRPTGGGPETPPPSKEGKTSKKNTLKQQPAAADDDVGRGSRGACPARRACNAPDAGRAGQAPRLPDGDTRHALLDVGFDARGADDLLTRAGTDVILRQLALLPRRSATRNRLGLLRRAILEDWPAPQADPAAARAAEFAGAFYAELAGGATVAEPSAADLRAAGKLAEAVGGDPAELGRTFAVFAKPGGASTLSAASRTHGDRFVRSRQARPAADDDAARAAHRERRLPAYRAFLRRRWAELEADRPGDFTLFARWRGAKRAGFAALPPAQRASREAHWQSEDGRLVDLRTYFGDAVPDFWAWDGRRK